MPVSSPSPAIALQAELHHQLLLGLQLMVATRAGPQASGDWMFRLFRRQHEEKFLSSFGKLGLEGLPHAVACARYHVLPNAIGGVAVEYLEESDSKAWVRFRYPRWMVDGAAICGVPLETSRAFLRGWYAHNGVSLRNPRLGFVCVSDDMSGQYGLCGYFKEYPHELTEAVRLGFAPHERPPPCDPARQPQPPAEDWDALRLAKAQRTCAVDGGPRDAAAFLATMFAGMGDDCRIEDSATGVRLHHHGLCLLRGLGAEDRADLLACWAELWRGTAHSHRAFMDLKVHPSHDSLCWIIEEGRDNDGVDA